MYTNPTSIYSYLFTLKISLFAFNLCLWSNADVGADVLDLAETMVASDGLKYEPVSYMCIYCVILYNYYCYLLLTITNTILYHSKCIKLVSIVAVMVKMCMFEFCFFFFKLI